MLTRKTHTLLLSLAVCLLATNAASAQTAQAGELLLFSTKESIAHADTAQVFTVADVEIEGNKKTRDKIILRELPFEEGARYSLAELIEHCNAAKNRLMNTGLFLDVTVGVLGTQGDEARILVSVKERWYFFPVPFVDVVGISYQKWLAEGMPLANVKYGLKLKHKNLSGLNDRLSFNITNGYMKELGLVYEGLPLDWHLHWALNFSFQTGMQRDIVYSTEGNKPVGLHDDNRYIYRYTHATGSVTWRPAIRTRHQFGVAWHDESFADTLSALNKHYLDGETRVRYPELFYNMSFQDLDFAPYPTKGLAAEIAITKKGFKAPVNLWQVSARASLYKPLTPKSFINLRATGLLKLPFRQPFTQQQFVGYNEMFLQGYESYVIDGVAGGFAKASFHRRILDHKFGIRIKKIPQLASIPVKIYAKVFANAGYIYNEQPGNNFLNNRLLTTAGLGLDIVLFYDFTFHLEWSLTGTGGNGLYLNNRSRW